MKYQPLMKWNIKDQKMNKNTTERCMAKAILNFIDEDEGIVVKDDVTGNKYIISTRHDNIIKIEMITGSDDCIVQNLSEGQIVYLDK